jgi:hypothetical protein
MKQNNNAAGFWLPAFCRIMRINGNKKAVKAMII